MRDYWNLVNECVDLGDQIKNEHFCDARMLANRLNISLNTFAKRFVNLPKFKSGDIDHPEKWGDAVLCKYQGILFVRMNQTVKKALNNYLHAKEF
ncbi:hypothetical protein LFYK43_17850 [Ligilactobacillus salitolerans]|uniref:Uncharacterized protein n=1 Tax=Ligilactobacillus salitolerans TaxID=1808352 RepID=A0A401IUY6_9LACO|nr:hypothetical protein [Ligilactobacillus salitolerans]GBG95326.1 hypothetical protein LFYK43_17850 [Ligilactobacillus salitolerans]